jgi:peptidoglycan hydrolase CwlO-like protein
MTEQELFKLKQRIDSAKTTVSELRGELTAGMKQLKDDWKQTTVDGAKTKLKSMLKEIEVIDTNITKQTEELESKFEEQ